MVNILFTLKSAMLSLAAGSSILSTAPPHSHWCGALNSAALSSRLISFTSVSAWPQPAPESSSRCSELIRSRRVELSSS